MKALRGNEQGKNESDGLHKPKGRRFKAINVSDGGA
uniref:Uncharacterized protein n=1 Tax=Rhizophora mucronata TaxID=61149 RepID=A0A2P2IJ56_RHIMU